MPELGVRDGERTDQTRGSLLWRPLPGTLSSATHKYLCCLQLAGWLAGCLDPENWAKRKLPNLAKKNRKKKEKRWKKTTTDSMSTLLAKRSGSPMAGTCRKRQGKIYLTPFNSRSCSAQSSTRPQLLHSRQTANRVHEWQPKRMTRQATWVS